MSIAAVGRALDLAVTVAPALEEEPPPRVPLRAAAATAWEAMRRQSRVPVALLRHFAPDLLSRLPIGIEGIAEAACAGSDTALSRSGIALPVYLYADINGVKRALVAAQHDRSGIASLFAGEERRLARLWPGLRGFDDRKAAESLLHFSACAGIVAGRHAIESAEDRQFRTYLGAAVRRLLGRGVDPYQVLGIACDWNRRRSPPHSEAEVITIVDAVCAAELRHGERGDDAA